MRLLDPADAERPEDDLIAVYTRRSLSELQVRLDFLDLQPDSAHDLYLVLSSGAPDGGAISDLPIQVRPDIVWDTLLVVPAETEPYIQAQDGQRRTGLPISRTIDPDLDTIYLDVGDLNASTLQSIQVFVTSPGSNQPVDETQAVRFDAPSPHPANLLMAFWNTLPAHTPAQALRRWDGAHTGPLGQRHGLFRLLEASSQANVPVALLDLKTPAALSALDFLGQLDYLRDMQAQGLAILPDAAYGDPQAAPEALQLSRDAAQSFGLGLSPLAFGVSSIEKLPQEYKGAFAAQPAYSHQTLAAGVRLIPLPALYPSAENQLPAWWQDQVGMAGLSIDARRALLDTALAQDPSRLILLGGSLPDSPWGDSSVAPQAFGYLAGHPWIQPLDETGLLSASVAKDAYTQSPNCADLLCMPPVLPVSPYTAAGAPVSSGVTQAGLRQSLLKGLQALPPNPLTRQAWETYLQLTQTTTDPYRQALQVNYLGEVGHLIRLAQWAADPKPLSDCSTDLDFDGQPECLLANDHFAATFETDGARLLFAAAINDGQAAQIIGPYSQSGAGWGDPRDWQIPRGPAADPNEIPGAFVDTGDAFRAFEANTQDGRLVFTSVDGSLEKIYALLPNGLRIHYQGKQPKSIQIPLTLGTASRFTPGWAAQYGLRPGADLSSLDWQAGGAAVNIQTQGASISTTTFLDSVDAVHAPENPDYAYPPGHFLPFPFTLLELRTDGPSEFTMELNVTQQGN